MYDTILFLVKDFLFVKILKIKINSFTLDIGSFLFLFQSAIIFRIFIDKKENFSS
nr:MAG TPA: hypothetical protein [Caudoviricetes sp.]